VECEKKGNGVDVSALTNDHNSGLKRFLRHYVLVLFKVVVCQLSLCQHLQRSGVEAEWRAGTGTIRCRCCYPDVRSGLVT
jgi:hypothetical protein